ncbi:MAG: glycosyltransferase family protein [Magnetococcales bacterium]|nr:glycosyltransferase family protein [Magnetococcales bacterium]MBF0148735.1 glycosyltransferase family protein [Magnetococcales bacterium]
MYGDLEFHQVLRRAEACFHRANQLVELGRLEAAVADYRQAVTLVPQWAEAHFNLGNTLIALGQLPEAEACYRQATEAKPDFAVAWFNRGHALGTLGRLEESLNCFLRGLDVQPEDAGGFNGLGNTLLDLNRLDAAEAAYRHAVALDPTLAEAAYNLGRVLALRGAFPEARTCYQTAVSLKPGFAQAHYNHGNTLVHLGLLEEAVHAYRQAVALWPGYAEAWYNLGNTLRESGALDAALATYDQALALKPDFAEVHFGIGVIRLLRGDFASGWPLYEWRWKKQDFPPHHHPQPLWQGQPLPGATLLVHCEQGFGDAIQFVRYLPQVKALARSHIILECPQPLRRLFSTLAGVDGWATPGGAAPPACVAQIPLMSLPHLLGRHWTFLPVELPYLTPAPEDVARFGKLLARVEGFKIGIAWRGSPDHKNDGNRSMDPEWWQTLREIPGCRFIGIQKGAREGDRDRLTGWDRFEDWSGLLTDFADTAALMVHLDLVLAVDTSVIHLAGALGRPSWLLLPWIPDWRWLLDRSDSPWYPGMRLFRQKTRGDWGGVMEEVKKGLESMLKK